MTRTRTTRYVTLLSVVAEILVRGVVWCAVDAAQMTQALEECRPARSPMSVQP